MRPSARCGAPLVLEARVHLREHADQPDGVDVEHGSRMPLVARHRVVTRHAEDIAEPLGAELPAAALQRVPVPVLACQVNDHFLPERQEVVPERVGREHRVPAWVVGDRKHVDPRVCRELPRLLPQRLTAVRREEATARDELGGGHEGSRTFEVLAKRRHRPSDDAPQERRAHETLQRRLALQHELQVELREPRMLARDVLGARPMPSPHRLEEHPMLVLGDEEDLVLARSTSPATRGARLARQTAAQRRSRSLSRARRSSPGRRALRGTRRSARRTARGLESACPTTVSSCSVTVARSSSSDGDSSRSAANRAAVPSRTPRSSIASATSLSVKEHTTNPPPGSGRSSPSCASVASASRSGVRETPSRSARPISGTRCSGASSTREDELAQPERRPGRLRAGYVAAWHVVDIIACSSGPLPISHGLEDEFCMRFNPVTPGRASAGDVPSRRLSDRSGVSPGTDPRERRGAVTLLPGDHGVSQDADSLDLRLDHVSGRR